MPCAICKPLKVQTQNEYSSKTNKGHSLLFNIAPVHDKQASAIRVQQEQDSFKESCNYLMILAKINITEFKPK